MTKEERIEKEKARLKERFAGQKELSRGARFVFGIDEAGRGPLCGPVVAACCMFFEDPEILYLNDSKKVAEKRRELIYDEIKEKAAAWGIGMADEKRIDDINILNATYEAMSDAFKACFDMYLEKKAAGTKGFSAEELYQEFDEIPGMTDSLVLVDGSHTVPGIMYRQKAIVKGDALCPSISAASILAKVTRDRLLLEYDRLYPEYGFRSNKGYGTAEHIEAIRKYGPLDIHRRSFIKKFI